ncbi:universal stress protein [Nitrosomonas sp. Nm33]|uniref:universal stress protein n=1 Tax=Nitrosomonas sp. Nm33 TaxID=133724 RepID=UPI0008946177|nr:universal stress protein [Nitrosomonas sp. Nm33]SDY13120.1 Nucleotide-binding universal stress protein, UspA family [Nitrosomonas sp. Nm33]
MYKKIMIAIDGSDTAQQALKEAVNIANTYNAALHIVHCVNDDTEAAKKAGSQILEQAQSYLDAVTIETSLLQAEVAYGLTGIADSIAAAASEWGADLLAVGTSNRRGLERLFMGSVAEQLISKVDASVLLVRPQKA